MAHSSKSIDISVKASSVSKMSKNSGEESDRVVTSKSRFKTASERVAYCYPSQADAGPKECGPDKFEWQNGKYVRDECGSGIVPVEFNFKNIRQSWCKTPLSLYQSTHGELGRRILCHTQRIVRDILPAPPCNMDEYILPFCRGYYRKYPCIRPCEERFVTTERDRKVYRNSLDRYWDPCSEKVEEGRKDVREIAPHNIVLAKRLRRQDETVALPCWYPKYCSVLLEEMVAITNIVSAKTADKADKEEAEPKR